MQGDLADPLYFDFISFCQSVVLAFSMRNGLQDFIEKVGAEGETLVVRRNEIYKDNKQLPTIHAQLTGTLSSSPSLVLTYPYLPHCSILISTLDDSNR